MSSQKNPSVAREAARFAAGYLKDETVAVAKDIVKQRLPGLVSAVRWAGFFGDIGLAALGSRGAKARISHRAACSFRDPPRTPSSAELKVVTILARKGDPHGRT